MSMKEAIERAKTKGYFPWYSVSGKDKPITADAAILLDPLFWSALSKSERWPEYMKDKHLTASLDHPKKDGLPRYEGRLYPASTWQYHIHRFMDHLASGGDVDSFFKELLTPNNKEL